MNYVVDMGEIPAFQERTAIDADGDGDLTQDELAPYREEACLAIGDGLRLRIDGTLVGLAVRSTAISLPDGQAGLSTLRLTCSFQTSFVGGGTHELDGVDGNHADRLGWREIVGVGVVAIRSRGSPSDGSRSGDAALPRGLRGGDHDDRPRPDCP